MDNDQRDRRDWPDSETPAEPPDEVSAEPEAPTPPEPEPPEAAEPSEPSAPAEPAEPADEPHAPAAEFETWPSQDASSPEASASHEAAAGEADEADEREETRAWPTEPPAAGSAPEDAWPTEAPERGDEPILEPARDDWSTSTEQTPDEPMPPEPAPTEPPPAEVEAYPSSDSAVPPLTPSAAAAAGAQSVPDTEGATGESTQCPRCGTENRPGLAFCRNCGQRLVAAGVAPTIDRPGAPQGTMACPRCGTHNRTGVAFCQNCGANLRGTAPGYVPPAVAGEGEAVAPVVERRGAILGPVVLLIGMVGLITGYLLPFLGAESLFDRAAGSGGYGIAFWSGYPDVAAGLQNQLYFGLAAPVPLFALILVVLAIAGFVRGAPGMLQTIGLIISLVWSVGLIVLFGVVEVGGNWSGSVVNVLRELTPAGIIFFLASLIVLIGTLTRFGRS